NGGLNYSVTLHGATGTITAAALDLFAASASKVYDGTTSSSATPTQSGLQPGDSVSASQSYTSKNVLGLNGSALVVDPGSVVSHGNGGLNYSVTLHGATG